MSPLATTRTWKTKPTPAPAFDTTNEKGPREAALRYGLSKRRGMNQSNGTMSSATMLMILMSGFTAGPAVSL